MQVFMFPGQGSQAKGMGGALFKRFGKLTDDASTMLGYSIRKLCLDDPRDELKDTRFTQPALYVVNALAYYARIEEAAKPPDFVMGHSLGEFNALLAAGCFDFLTGLELVRFRGQLMGRAENGAMAAIVNANQATIERTLIENGLTQLSLANYNTPSQIVISGAADEMAKAQLLFNSGDMRCYPLNTSGAFHSPFMRSAREEFARFLQSFRFAAPSVPVISNVSARPYESAGIDTALASQIDRPVRWCDSIQYLLGVAARRGEQIEFEELGNGDVLTRLVQAIRQQTSPEVIAHIATEVETGSTVAPMGAVAADARSAADKVAAWNRRYPVGTRVTSKHPEYRDLVTRTEAVVLFNQRAAVYMEGYHGYFDLNELTAA
ncbi:ACP S-malonyltransferase (plasmid) [Burkholderia sp. FERM BP-3421]|jgi:malonyl CoA-acyl carrier protein transacylase|uniref:[acyl-carrier-protein] S-malonyltransferase n=1 Tax=Pseudomonas sp. 2663 TaxID=764483 RepID=E9KSN2_9PSED|nr:ACP S-malonyltransferase [Burkholderia sp. FERM BP-3421]ADH01496.1 malonyl CoA-acyl carrier protein transacylase [Pseudomonas sp. 2663]AIC32701.1 FR9O [Burkholderia sp. FERM BP-3421]WDD90496.1 ACP S-malonyltransferase [Burkholderia sp. FERM BP-3421]